MHKYFILLSLLFSFSVFAQYEIRGTITDNTNEKVSFANIQIHKGEKLISYGTSNTNGAYVIKLKSAGTYSVKVTHMQFVPLEDTLVVSDDQNTLMKNYILTENAEDLGEVILKFEPKVMEISTDTITYNIKALTNGTENNLADVIDKLPGVELNASGLITVNGKAIKKLLIDGEELFKKQHRLTAESVTSEMVEGIRYLDKFKDFGNISGFDNKQMRALDISIKDEYKNKITGDVKAGGGYADKTLGHVNLYRLGGRLKIGFIGDYNSLGRQSITSNEYDQLTQTIEQDDFSSSGIQIREQNEQTPKFFDPTTDVSKRENGFGAFSFIYKPKENFKISLLNLSSNTAQKQRFLLTRNFFEDDLLFQEETRNVTSGFFLNTSLLELGYQPNEYSFFSYVVNYSPQQSDDEYRINTSDQNGSTDFLQQYDNEGWSLDQQLSFVGRIGAKTLLKWSGLAEIQELDANLDITASAPFLGLNFNDDFKITQFQKQNSKRFGYELQAVTNYKHAKLDIHQGVLFSDDVFGNEIAVRDEFTQTTQTDRTDSYIGVRYRGKIAKKLEYKTALEYRYLFFKRFDEVFDDYFVLPSVSMNYKINSSKQLDISYSYDFELPGSKTVHSGDVAEDFFTKSSISMVAQNEIFPSHTIRAYFMNFKASTGSNFFAFADYNYAPEFLSSNTFLSQTNVVNTQNIVGDNRQRLMLGSRINYRVRKLKANIFVNTDWFLNQEENQIGLLDNIAETSRFSQKLGIYSGYRKGVNYNLGVDYQIIDYSTSVNSIETKSVVTKPYLYITGSFFKKKASWSLGGEYAIYKTDLTQTEIMDIKPTVRYKLDDNWELTLEGNNILNIDNSEIAENINTSNYTESRISDTLEGYLVLGVYYRLK
ncbi:TonB-dependent receptor [Aquimarina addita]|uniref:TonB-dependent receptor n=1 Tax=Aquimarina addita TaxID=870485 RepID=A0ABP7X7V4_9FLAO